MREIGSPRSAYHASLASGGARHLFFAGYQKQPRHRAADDRRSQSNADRVLAIARIHLSLPPSPSVSPGSLTLLVSLSSRPFFSLFCPPPLPLARPSHPFAFLRVVRAYEFDFTRFPSIGESTVNYFSSSRSRPALLRTCTSPSLSAPPPPRSHTPRTPG